MELTVPKELTKELIESKISQETLISNYYGVPIKKGLFCAKHRADSHPTCCYYKRNGRIYIKDFGSDYYGDWIYVVEQKFNCNYYDALAIAANDFDIQKIPHLNKNKVKISNESLSENKQSIIRVEIRDFQQYELDWWNKFGISLQTLKKFRVFSCKNIWINDHIIHLETNNQLVFGYYGGIKDGIEQWKLYWPNNKKYKWLSNRDSSQLQGARMLPKSGGDYIVITKSLKDVMVLYEFNIPAIAPNSETLFISDKQLEKLKSKFKNIVVFYDNDCAGISGMNKIKKNHKDLKYVFIPRKYEAKDISDFYKKYGKEKTQKLINSAIEYYVK